MAGSLLDIYGNYNRAMDEYYRNMDQYYRDIENFNKSVNAWNASIITNSGSYSPDSGRYSGSGPYTTYNGSTLGRTGTPISTYQTDPIGYNTETDFSAIQGYDNEGNPIYGTKEVPYYGGTNETTYVDPTTGLASVFPSQVGSEPVEPGQPLQPPFPAYGYGEDLFPVDPQTLYQSTFGRGTPDVLTNEAWSLQNISTPFLSSIGETAYDKGNVAKVNNPLSYMGPQEFITGQNDQNTLNTIQGINPYY